MKWEYKVNRMSVTASKSEVEVGHLEADLNYLGQQGWEAVSWWHTTHQHMDDHGLGWKIDTLVLFKRPISQ